MNYATAITFLMLSVAATADKTDSFSVGDKVALAEGSLRGRLVSAETHAGVKTVPDEYKAKKVHPKRKAVPKNKKVAPKRNTSPTEADPINGGNKIESFVTYSRGVDSCSGISACNGAGNVGVGSCNGDFACHSREGDVGDHSCNGEYACDDGPSTVGDDSCNGYLVCEEEYDDIGDNERNDVGCEEWRDTDSFCRGPGGSRAGGYQLGGIMTAEDCLVWCRNMGNGCCMRNIQDLRCMWTAKAKDMVEYYGGGYHAWRATQCRGGSSVQGDLSGITIEG